MSCNDSQYTSCNAESLDVATMDIRRERETGKSVTKKDSNALDKGKSSGTELEEIDAKRKRTGELGEDHRNQKRRCDDFSDIYVPQTSAGDEVLERLLGLKGNLMESGLSVTERESSVISGKGVTTGDEVGAESSCDPLEVIAELWKKYDEHCAFVEANPDCEVLKLSLEEFVGQTDADESEFDHKDTLETIWLDIIHNQEYTFEERIKLWKQRHNRFVQVQWLKRKKEEEADRNTQ